MSAPRVLVVDDETDIRSLVQEILADEGYLVTVAANGEQARLARAQQEPDLILLDIWMPDIDGITLLREWVQPPGMLCPVVMMSGHGTVETAVEATRLGAFDFVEKPLSLAKLLRTVKTALDAGRRKRQDSRSLVPQVLGPVGRSRPIQQLRELIQRVAPHDTAVAIVGEPGTGRQMLARYIHGLSARANARLVVLVPGNINDRDAAMTLFGSEEGGVQQGVLEQANGGTLFIGDLVQLSPALRRLLLSSLRQGSFTRVNGHGPQALDVRILASVAASPPFDEDEASYRDLLVHLNAVTIQVPPLRDCA
ncbi:MAG: sigma-54-dependent Fis family transcriptional regulator, partial [Candidatus Obscuribacterales bacterium]|nr:sigma-54-dependent Fis family transcriptional regulator [Steroidobacteraceae bacterium]